MTWAFEEANSKLLDDVVSVAEVEAKEPVNGSLVKFLQLKFGPLWLWQHLRLKGARKIKIGLPQFRLGL